MLYRAALFDLDGTLIDTDELVLSAFQHALQVRGHPEVDAREVRSQFGRPNREAFAALVEGDAEALTSSYREYFCLHHDRLAKAFPGVEEGLRALRDAGIRTGVVTSRARESALVSLRRFALDGHVEVVVAGDDCRRSKPDPEPVQRAAAALGLPAPACLMIGDSPHDMASGRRASAATAAVRWSSVDWTAVLAAGPDHVLDTMDDLPALFRD
jgi:pyrophosphatase PpaX